ncbi:DUF4190 domain-containing protein [Lacibacter luteus]|uniref:DUF4190 domain-containing protein n=1 Tax=Lacibacter luteus TaxID=2508719 RepID=A0A4Q1CLI3_9BACT|nr:CCC motif membrane protein [Lacibacter luteus]RXK61614.1 DUF4190 domain-containing protein [Lacibacter luteus]
MDQFQQQRPLPNATIVLVLGILSIIACCFYGLGIILGIVAIVLAAKDKKLFAAEPELYTASSLKNLNAGRVCAIIGLILSALYLILIIVMIATFGIEAMRNPDEMMRRMQELQG